MTTSQSSSIADSLAEVETIKRMHQSVKEYLKSSNRTDTPVETAAEGRGDGLDYHSSTPIPDRTTASTSYDEPSRITYPPSSLADGQKYPENSVAANQNHSQPPPDSYYPSSSDGYMYVSSSSGGGGGGVEIVARGESVTSREKFEELQSRLAKLSVSSDSSHDTVSSPAYPTTSATLVESSVMSNSHPTSASVAYNYSRIPEDRGYPYSSVSTTSSGSTTATSASSFSQGSRPSEEALRDEILILRRQLQAKEAQIEAQQQQLKHSGPKMLHTASPGHSGPIYAGHRQHSGPIHPNYSGPIQVSANLDMTVTQYYNVNLVPLPPKV